MEVSSNCDTKRRRQRPHGAKPHDFDRPSTKEEALDRLERTAGPHARKMLERFLEQVQQAEAKYKGETETETEI